MSLTINAKTFAPDSYSKDQVIYYGPAHTVQSKDDLKLSRTAPKPTAVYSGNSRQSSRFTRTVSLTDALTSKADVVIEIQTSIPVGVAAADVDAIVADVAAWVGHASFKINLKNGTISY